MGIVNSFWTEIMARTCLLVFALFCSIAAINAECIDKRGCKRKIDMEGPEMCKDPQVAKDCCALCKAYKGWPWEGSASACVDKRGCKRKIDMEGPGMCKDPQVAKDCCALCEAYKGWGETRSSCVDKRGCKKKLDMGGPNVCKDPKVEKDCCALCKVYKNWITK